MSFWQIVTAEDSSSMTSNNNNNNNSSNINNGEDNISNNDEKKKAKKCQKWRLANIQGSQDLLQCPNKLEPLVEDLHWFFDELSYFIFTYIEMRAIIISIWHTNGLEHLLN